METSILLWISRGSAKALGSAALLIVIFGAAYYVIRTGFVWNLRRQWIRNTAVSKRWQGLIPKLRAIHPYIVWPLMATVALHGWYFLARLGIRPRTVTGLTAAAILLMMALSGLMLKRRPAARTIRLFHRILFFVLIAVLLVHA